jgi:iron complex transport system substrate-binding protein
VTGVSGSRYITGQAIRRRISEGKTTDVGYGQNLNFEEIIRQKPDLVMVYGVDSEITGYLDKFRDLGIPTVLVAEYLEETPLGKAEWVRFVAEFFMKGAAGDSIFSSIERNYTLLAEKALHVKKRPVVMVGLPYRETWWVPGGKSYLARLIEDAGGEYTGRENSSHESYVISMEEAITISSRADIWINTGTLSSKEEILASDSRFSKLPLYTDARIYNNNKNATSAGGMDFWESGTMHPDLILGDLIRILHPGLLPDAPFHYYQEIR